MTFKVVVADDIAPDGLVDLLESTAFEVQQGPWKNGALSAALTDADALLVRSATQVTEAVLQSAPRLKVIGRAGIGVDNIDLDQATQRGIAVLNAPGANTVSAAEHTFALLLSLVRNVPDAVMSMRDGAWDRKKFGGTELRGKALGLIGLGRIGAHVAHLGRAFGMDVLAYDPFLPEARAVEMRVRLVDLDTLLNNADVISLHAPLTDSTRHVVSREALTKVKPSAVLVNTARGALVDEDALIEALNEGRLRAAALDVFPEEPLATDSRLRHVPGLSLTPHLAASTEEAQLRVAAEVCAAVRRVLEAGDIGGAVNVPGVSSEVLSRAREPMDLALRMGRLAASVQTGAVQTVEVDYGGQDDQIAKPVMLASVVGVLEAIGVSPVSLINVTVLSDQRRMNISRRVGKPRGGYRTTIGVTLANGKASVNVVGALDAAGAARIIAIDGHEVDIPAHGIMLVLRNRDVPGVVGKVGTVLGNAGLNIASYHQSPAKREGDDALAAIAIDQIPDPSVVESLRQEPDVTGVWLASIR